MDDKLTHLINYVGSHEKQTRNIIGNLEAKLQSQEVLLVKSTERLAQLEGEVGGRSQEEMEGKKAEELLGSLHQYPAIDEAVALNQVAAGARVSMPRTCYAARKSNPSLPSGIYWIDPDGEKMGDPPILVFCNMTTGMYRQLSSQSPNLNHRYIQETRSSNTTAPWRWPAALIASVPDAFPGTSLTKPLDSKWTRW